MLFDNSDLYKSVSNMCMKVAEAAVRKSKHPKSIEFEAEAREYISAQLSACVPFFEEPKDRRAGKSPLLTSDRTRLEALLASGYLIDERFQSKTSLNHAVLDNDVEIARILIKHGADPNAIGTGGATILHQVIVDWHLSDTAKVGLVEFLIENGANFQEKESRNESPFIVAVRANKLDIVEIMIQAGADVNRRESRDNGRMRRIHTPLLHAASVDMAELLLGYGADPNLAGLYGRTPLIHAAVNNTDMTRLLICSGARVNAVDDAGWTPLMYAVLLHKQDRNGDKDQFLKRIKILLEHGADTNMKNKLGETAYNISSNGKISDLLLESENTSASGECNSIKE
jgi:ankyrin repeat protein